MCDTQSNSFVAYFGRPWVEITHFQKSVYKQEVFCSVIDCIMKLKCWFCGHDKDACYVYAYIIHTYTHTQYAYMYNGALYSYMHPHWQPLQSLCSWSEYRPGRDVVTSLFIYERAWQSFLLHISRFTNHNHHDDPFMFLLIFSVLIYFYSSRFCPFCLFLNVLISDNV